MSKLKVYNDKGASVGETEVPDAMLELKKGKQVLQDAVTAYRAAQRAGTASTKRKGEVAGSNKKPWRQKGTGRARAGYRQSPVWRGGGVAFGPHPRDYRVKVNKKAARLAFRRALSEKLAAGAVQVLETLAFDEVKTKRMAEMLKALKVSAPLLIVLDKVDRNVALSARNLPGVEVAEARSLNVYQLLRYPTVLVTKAGLEVLTGRLENKGDSK